MSQKECTCPSFEGKTYDELITSFGLLGRKDESKNCCEEAGYICPNLSSALSKAYNRKYYFVKKDKNESIQRTSNKKHRTLTKRQLQVR